MGEYAIDQMMRDFKGMTGQDADRSMFEYEERPREARVPCRKCGKKFKTFHAVADHLRDKHGAKP